MSGLPEVVPSPSQCPQDGVDLLQPTSQHDISDHIDPNGHVRTDQDSPDQHDSTDETSDIMAFQTNGSADSGCSLHCEGKTGVELDKHDQDEAALVGGHFPLSSLPTDTLLHVFSFLRKNEQLRMSAVCKPWRQLIFSSACLWRKRQLTLRCSRHSRHSRNAFFYARRLGHYLHKLTVACEHPSNHSCRSMAICFRKLMTGLKAPASLRSFKVNDLRLRYTRASVLLDISDSLERFIHSLQHLKCFQMSNAQWSAQEGVRVITSVLTACQATLRTLRIDGFFVPRLVPARAADVLTTGLGGLRCLSKLSIDYFYLNDQSVLSLASARRGQLRSLKLVACDVTPRSRFVSRTAWLVLTRSSPSMRVEFAVQGFTVSPALSLPLLLSPALRVHRLSLSIGNQYTFLDTPRLNMAAVLTHVTRHFRRRLTRFEMDVDNHSDSLDAALIRLVRKCRNLVSVKVKAYFNNPQTDVTLRKILRVRREKQDAPDTGAGGASTVETGRVMGSESTRHDVTETEAPRRDIMGSEAPRQDVMESEASRPDVMRSEASRRDLTESDAQRRDVMGSDTSRRDPMGTEASRLGVVRLGAPIQDADGFSGAHAHSEFSDGHPAAQDGGLRFEDGQVPRAVRTYLATRSVTASARPRSSTDSSDGVRLSTLYSDGLSPHPSQDVSNNDGPSTSAAVGSFSA